MTTAEKITAGVAIAGALGLGALLKSWVDHLLSRREKKVTLADKSVQIAEALMTRMEAELTRAQEALTKAQQESEELREELARTAVARSEYSVRVVELQQKLQESHVAAAKSAIDNIQEDVHRIRILDGGSVDSRVVQELVESLAAAWSTTYPGRAHGASSKVRMGRTEAG